jgi:hypothetical protein
MGAFRALPDMRICKVMTADDAEKLARDIIAKNPTDDWIYEELGRQDQGENAFGDQLLTRGKQIFHATSLSIGNRLCGNPAVHVLAERSDATAGDVFVILPLLINLLSPTDVQPATIALIGVVVSRMGLRAFCARYGHQ